MSTFDYLFHFDKNDMLQYPGLNETSSGYNIRRKLTPKEREAISIGIVEQIVDQYL